MSNQVILKDELSGQILFETTIEKIDEAYQYAAILEAEGLSIQLIAPAVSETLINSLGASKEEILIYQKSTSNEIDDHDLPNFLNQCKKI